jgi:tripartite-type tricarboxylate transporter receptor subunit TctC
MHRRTFGLGTASLALIGPVAAQEVYPSRPIRLLVPFSPGGTTDLFARKFAERIGRVLGQSVVVENKAGASGAIAAAEAARARPDGYTLFFATSTTLAILPTMMSRPTYDVERDFSMVALVGVTPLLLSVTSSVPAHTTAELVALIKARPGQFSFGTSGVGSANHLAGELFKLQAGGLDVLHVPYRGSGPALQDALVGRNAVFFDSFVTLLPHHREGRMRILSVFSAQRSRIAPEIPTAIEEGIPDMIAGSFQVLVAPSAVPAPIIEVLQRATGQIMRDGSFQDELLALGNEPVTDSTPERTRDFVHHELTRWAPIIRATGATLD